MTGSALVQGLAIGFALAVPVGPAGILCIRNTLVAGRGAGFASGLGAAVADAFYGAVVAFGLHAVSNALLAQHLLLRVIGGGVMVALGVRTFFAQPLDQPSDATRNPRLASVFGSSFVLTASNPMTMVALVAVFATLGLGAEIGDGRSAPLLVVGILLGSTAWWLMLSTFVARFRERFRTGLIHSVIRISAGAITGFGLLAMTSTLL